MRRYFERMRSGGWVLGAGLVFTLAMAGTAPRAHAEDALLAEMVDFAGTFIYLGVKPPALVIGAIRNGETVVRGYGAMSIGSG
jgi:serine-type D-Ala-D-Ala carboxypeptidase/endopeptidase